MINPFGPQVWLYAVGLSTNPEVTARITEWQPTTLRTVPGMLFFASALAVVVLWPAAATGTVADAALARRLPRHRRVRDPRRRVVADRGGVRGGAAASPP